jgi:hypothetical protein
VGGASLGNYVFTAQFFSVVLIFSVVFGAGYGLKPEIELIDELRNRRQKIDELTKEVEDINKADEESPETEGKGEWWSIFFLLECYFPDFFHFL